MKRRTCLAVLLITVLFVFCETVHAENENHFVKRLTLFVGDPFKMYKRAKRKDAVRRLSVTERTMILDSAWREATRDSAYDGLMNPVRRNEMITDIVISTPLKDVPALLDSMHLSIPEFGQRFFFLPTILHAKVVAHLASAFKDPDRESVIFPSIPCAVFREQMCNNIRCGGDNLMQSHATNFCGKVALTRLWIQNDSNDYKRFMTDLYYTGRAVWNGMEFITPPEVVEAVNENKITWDPDQVLQFGDEKLPQGMDMVLYLTFAASFQTFPYNLQSYDPQAHRENTPWAGAAINPQLRFLRSMGFEAVKVGDNFRGITNEQFTTIKSASFPGSQKRVVLLVNSSILDTLSGAGREYNVPRGLEHLTLGTHWITVDEINPETDVFAFWEYGRHRTVKGVEQMKEIIAGGIIITGYDPK